MNRFVQKFGDSQNGKRLLEYRSDLVSDIADLPLNDEPDTTAPKILTGSFTLCLEDKNTYMFSEHTNSWDVF